MKDSRLSAIWLLLLALFAGGCNAVSPATQAGEEAEELATSVALTVNAFLAEQETSKLVEHTPTSSQTSLPSETLSPTDTPTITLTATPITPLIEVSAATNCRSGPGVAYIILGALDEDETSEVVGRTADPEYVVIANPDNSGNCWLWLQAATISASIDHLPLVDIPPTPTPSLTPTPTVIWEGNWVIWVGPATLTQYSMTITRTGNAISGTFDAGGGNTVNLTGSLSTDLTYASGTWSSTAGDSGTFEWQRKKNINQFTGNLDGGPEEWCGAREGASQPTPCFGP